MLNIVNFKVISYRQNKLNYLLFVHIYNHRLRKQRLRFIIFQYKYLLLDYN